ncbi:NUDIX hydrolase [Devosia sp. A16]|uniref:NUDIX hydrolase n=1 Tax=Devosia sp. A16 TaxID=1736675 RepID=UPI0006D844EB|nr:NUDIX hydrolase [Devosia sp. A16]
MTTAGPAVGRPVAAVLAVVIRSGEVLLVRRANPPDAGLWGFPGGKIEPGETIHDAAARELLEETGVEATPQLAFASLDALDHDGEGRLRSHYVLIAVLCRWQAGEPAAADDALEARWASLATLADGTLELIEDVAAVAATATLLASAV